MHHGNRTTHRAEKRDPSGRVLARVAAQPGHRPSSATAVVASDRRLTFHGLDRASGRVGAYLRALGARPDGCVGVFLELSADLIVAVWGVLHSGAAYLPLSTDDPEDRLRFMMEDSGARVIITQDHLAARAAAFVPPHTAVVTVDEMNRTSHNSAPAVPAASSLAYVIYTPGSTGKPKGVMIEHHSIVSQIRWLRSSHYLSENATILQKTAVCFDAAQWEILAPAVGARVVVGAPALHRDPPALLATIREHGVTTLQCVPTLLQALVDTGGLPDCPTLAPSRRSWSSMPSTHPVSQMRTLRTETSMTTSPTGRGSPTLPTA